MIEGQFERDHNGIMRPYINLDVNFHEPLNIQIEVRFLVDTGADRTLLSPFVSQHLYSQFDFDIRSLERGQPIVGVGGQIHTRIIEPTIILGWQWFKMPIPIIDAPPGPNSMPSLLGRDIMDYFALFMQRGSGRALFLDEDEAEEFINIPARSA